MGAYAGDLTPTEAWSMLVGNENAVLVDVRTRPEWLFVGVPDLSKVDKKPVFLEWQIYPTMDQNPGFVGCIKELEIGTDTPLLFLCRTGSRSRAAASVMTDQGFDQCYNISDGFEGCHDIDRHRGKIDGWKNSGLPWLQG